MILLTGGAGYIGSHTLLELLQSGEEVLVVDNFVNSKRESVRRVEELTGKCAVGVEDVDLCDEAALDGVFERHRIDAVIHFAGLKAVGESTQQPLRYYHNNITGTLNLLRCMEKHRVYRLAFSSSATVYGAPERLPIDETHPLSATNAYGRSKLHIEEMLRDVAQGSVDQWRIIILRYFNPIGAHASGRIGEDPQGPPNNLVPYIAQVAVGRRACLSVFGGDYETRDGTGVRDYIHVVDLAKGHVAALARLSQAANASCEVYNLGTGNGVSVLEMVKAMEEASGKTIAYEMKDRRPGDIASCYADATQAKQMLGWTAQFDLQRMCEDTWRWQEANPNGYV